MKVKDYDNLDFKKASTKFQKQKHRLAKDITCNLQFMLDYINKCVKPTSQLSEQQRKQVKNLQEMDHDQLKCIFVQIVNSILSNILYSSYFKNCEVKLQKLTTHWIPMYIFFDDKQIRFTNRKKVFSFLIQQLECVNIAETQLQFKYKDVRKLIIRFQNQNIAKSIAAKIHMLIENHQKQKNLQTEQLQIEQKRQFQQTLSQDYILYSKINQNIFLTHKIEPKIHVNLFLKGQGWNIGHLAEFLIFQKYWNSKTVSENKIVINQTNQLLMERKMQSSILFSLERRTLTQIKFFKINESCYVIEQVPYPGVPMKKSIILSQLNIKYTVDFLSYKTVKVTIDCSFDGKGYCSTSGSRTMLIDLFIDTMKIQQKYRKLKQKGRLDFTQFLQRRFVNKADKKNQAKKNKQERVQNVIGSNEQLFYSITSNQKYLNNPQIKLQKLTQVKDISSLDDNQFEEQFQTEATQEIKHKNRKQDNILNRIGHDRNFMQIICKNYYKGFQKQKPHLYDQQITIQYIKMIKQRIHEKNYLNKRFNLKQKQNFGGESPSYDATTLIYNRKQYELNEQNELISLNFDDMSNQKDSLFYIIKQIGSNEILSKDLLNSSLPVDILQSRSLLERICSSFGCAPKYLKPVANADIYTQMKAVIGFALSINALQLVMLKPFNPILGQTFQGYLGGVPIYSEQISTQPQISSYYMTCAEFTISGNVILTANVSLNTIKGGNASKMYIRLRNGSEFQVCCFPTMISGLIYGKRKYSIYEKAYIIQRKSRLVAQISIRKQSKGLYEWRQLNKKPTEGDIIGGIFKVKQLFFAANPPPKSLLYYTGLKKCEVEQRKDIISGLWFSQIYIGNQIINKGITAFPIQYADQLLPSDSNYRLDILMHRFDDLARSQTNNQILFQNQKRDQYLRQTKGNFKLN